ncbi:uncharacterized protein LOC126697411 [Quercus robur]|uniref:uncharacterized protein LOC126697411 n=1 Tax=Quercus robur TaxID=38942 RepID=UPI0021630897|nr:uncharacterized protein LOC126697411 [Quercus robur]
MNCEQHMVDRPSPSATKTSSSCTERGYVKGLVTYMVMDDLEVKLMSTISSITLLINKFNVKGIRALEEKVVNFGMDEVLTNLLWSFGTKLLAGCKSGQQSFETAFWWLTVVRLTIDVG